MKGRPGPLKSARQESSGVVSRLHIASRTCAVNSAGDDDQAHDARRVSAAIPTTKRSLRDKVHEHGDQEPAQRWQSGQSLMSDQFVCIYIMF